MMSNKEIMEQKEIYFVGDELSTRYFHVIDENTVEQGELRISIPRERFLDFIATARVLGLKAGKL